MTAPMSDALAAAAVVTAVLAALFTLWQGDVTAALEAPKSSDSNTLKASKERVRNAILGRTLPLFLTTAATFGILIFRVWGILVDTLQSFGASKWSYDDASAMLVLTELLILLLWVAVAFQFRALLNKLKELGTTA